MVMEADKNRPVVCLLICLLLRTGRGRARSYSRTAGGYIDMSRERDEGKKKRCHGLPVRRGA